MNSTGPSEAERVAEMAMCGVVCIGGISAGTIGAAGADLMGRAYNIRQPADIVGTYTALSGSAAIGAGVKAIRLQNLNGVVLELRGPEAGLEASASLSGMGISLP